MRRWSLLSCAAFAAVALAACGGDEESSTEAWAGDVCSATLDWRNSVEAAADSVRESPSEETLDDAVADVTDATDELSDDLDGLEAPESDAGEEAKALVDQLATTLRNNVAAAEKAVAEADDAAGAVAASRTVAAALTSMREQVSATVTQLRDLDADDELADAIDDADSCDELRNER